MDHEDLWHNSAQPGDSKPRQAAVGFFFSREPSACSNKIWVITGTWLWILISFTGMCGAERISAWKKDMNWFVKNLLVAWGFCTGIIWDSCAHQGQKPSCSFFFVCFLLRTERDHLGISCVYKVFNKQLNDNDKFIQQKSLCCSYFFCACMACCFVRMLSSDFFLSV